MEQYLEFIGNNLILVGIWIALALALIFHRSKTGAQAVGPQQAVMLINRNDGVVLDIRDKKDYDTGHIVDSVHIPHTKLSAQLDELEKLKSRPIIVVCKMGQHSGDACKILRSAGFEQVVRLRGGMAEWRAQNLPLIQKADKGKSAEKKAEKGKTGKPRPKKSRKSAAPVAAESASLENTGVTDEAVSTEPGQTASDQVDVAAGQEKPQHKEGKHEEVTQEEVKQGDKQ
ncbi:MAG: hypothetical protein CMQ34_00390 [Gammaproteobacteria bacterium]|nr:hypothetical protein [Gammaproteobacteria bacterium]|tara:strand:+ start:1713 stop:2399 length:687 start_codon:yes stop_codon:yes gene_type:complete